MFAVTSRAYAKLSHMLLGYPENVAVRVVFRRGRIRLLPSKRRAGDAVFEHEHRTVLLLDERVIRRLDGKTLSVRTTENRSKLRLRGSRQSKNTNR